MSSRTKDDKSRTRGKEARRGKFAGRVKGRHREGGKKREEERDIPSELLRAKLKFRRSSGDAPARKKFKRFECCCSLAAPFPI